MIDTFPDSWRWNYRHREVRFYAWRNSGLVLCRVSREAIEDHYGDLSTPNACVRAAKGHVNDIADRLSDRAGGQQRMVVEHVNQTRRVGRSLTHEDGRQNELRMPGRA